MSAIHRQGNTALIQSMILASGCSLIFQVEEDFRQLSKILIVRHRLERKT